MANLFFLLPRLEMMSLQKFLVELPAFPAPYGLGPGRSCGSESGRRAELTGKTQLSVTGTAFRVGQASRPGKRELEL